MPQRGRGQVFGHANPIVYNNCENQVYANVFGQLTFVSVMWLTKYRDRAWILTFTVRTMVRIMNAGFCRGRIERYQARLPLGQKNAERDDHTLCTLGNSATLRGMI